MGKISAVDKDSLFVERGGWNNKRVQLTELGISRFLDKHIKNGYVVVPASRSEQTSEMDDSAYADLKKSVKSRGLSFVPVICGYTETREEGGEQITVEEKSLIIPPARRNGEVVSLDDLRKIGQELAAEYHQDSFLFNDGNIAYEIAQDGTTLNDFGDDVKVNNLAQLLFTRLNRRKNETGKRCSYSENKLYFYGKSNSYFHNLGRYTEGEIELWLYRPV